MRLPDIQLDDRSFQDIVSEARTRIAQLCPEWTEHNVSDPGITLIELFAWMTDMTLYRVNRIPDKLHIALLDLLGIELAGPTAATTEIRFRLAGPAFEPVPIAAGTEVGTVRTATEQSVIFQVDEDFTIAPLRPVAFALHRDERVAEVGITDGTARPAGQDQVAFGTPPRVDDALYLGFDQPIGKLLLELAVEASQARGAGIEPNDPPLAWEVSQGDGEWAAATVLSDLTGGFNFGSGKLEIQCPPRSGVDKLGDERRHWLRCRITAQTRRGRTDCYYTHAPEIYSVTAAPVGALLPSTHATQAPEEPLGESDGTPGQVFSLRNRPVVPPGPGETLQVREPGSAQWLDWQAVETFADSAPDDTHHALHRVAGEIELGPTIRQPDGSWRRHGAVPPKGSVLRFTGYRFGGGRAGNVLPQTLKELKGAIPGVVSVTNPRLARGGVDPEEVASARQRAALEIRTRYRAVTARDFEILAREATPQVARAVCGVPERDEPVVVHVLPRIEPADRRLVVEELIPSEELLTEVAMYLDERRLLGTTIELAPMRFRGVSVVVEVQAAPLAHTGRVEEDVAHALYTYLNPLVGGELGGLGSGWPYGRSLSPGELYGIVHAIDGVEFASILRVYETDLLTGRKAAKPIEGHLVLEPHEVIASSQHVVKAIRRKA